MAALNQASILSPGLNLLPMGVGSLASEQKVGKIRTAIKELWQYTNQLNTQAANSGTPIQTIVATHSFTHSTPLISWAIGFANLLDMTIHDWHTPGFNRTGSVVTLAFMAAAATHTVFLYYLNYRQTAQSKLTTETNQQIQEIHQTTSYLQKSAKLGMQLLTGKSPEQFAFSFQTLKNYGKTLPKGLIPKDLKAALAEANALNSLPSDDPERAQLPSVVQVKIFPLVNHYMKQLKAKLSQLGYTPPAPPAALSAPVSELPTRGAEILEVVVE